MCVRRMQQGIDTNQFDKKFLGEGGDNGPAGLEVAGDGAVQVRGAEGRRPRASGLADGGGDDVAARAHACSGNTRSSR